MSEITGMKPINLLIVANTPSDNTQKIANAVYAGAIHPDIDDVNCQLLQPLAATPQDVLKCDGIIIGTTENFGYMSGQIKDFFERIYYPCLETKQGLPYALYIRAGKDGSGTLRAVHSITQGLRWREVQAPTLMSGQYQDSFLQSCSLLGTTMAAGLSSNIF